MNKFQKVVNKGSKRLQKEVGYNYRYARKVCRSIMKDYIKVMNQYPSWKE